MPSTRPPVSSRPRRHARPSLLACRVPVNPGQTRHRPEQREGEITAREGFAIEMDGRPLRNFCSSDYLGLSQHPEVIARLQEAAAWRGIGAGMSNVMGQRYREHHELEEAIAQWQDYPRALLFGSAYVANLALMQVLLKPEEVCIQDRLNHASLKDGTRLAGARLGLYPHLSADGALRQLRASPDTAALLATNGVFALDGDMAPLKLLAVLARTENAILHVDDTHGAGVIGPDGRGSAAHAGLGANEVPLQLISLSRALGCAGAVLVGQSDLIEHIAGTARSYLYSSLPPPALAAAATTALAIARREPWRRYKLAGLVARLRRGAQQLGVELMDSVTPIQPVVIGSSTATLAAQRQLERAGFLVYAIRPPVVPDGRARLRITLNAAHEEADIDALLEVLAQVMAQIDNG